MAQHRIQQPDVGARSDRQSFVEAVARRLGTSPTAELERQILVVLALLGARLSESDARAVASRLPRRFGQSMTAARDTPGGGVTVAELLERLGERQVDERTCRATCQVLADAVGEQGRAHLRVQPLSTLFDR